MKLIIVVNNITDTFETCILSRELSGEEIVTIHQMMDHGSTRTVHIAECGDKAIPFLDIMEELKKVVDVWHPEHPIPPLSSGKLHNLRGLPTKYVSQK